MSTRIPLPYGPRVLELFRNPKNMGKMEDATISLIDILLKYNTNK